MTWPGDADGDVLRRIEERGLDFSKPHAIDFNIDFADWPPAAEAIAIVRRRYPAAVVYEPQDGYPGYILFQVCEPVSYELVIRIQREVSALVAPFEGYCESWGVMQG
jgi:hypothetical protein